MAKRKVSVLLKEDVNKLGKVGDLVEVKPGYARNYLIPQGKAISPTPGILKQAEHWREVKQWRFLEEKRNAEAQKATLEAIGSFSIYKQTGEAETIYGTVTNQEIAGIIFKTTGYELDRRKIDIPKIGKIGGYTAKVKLHPEVKASLNIQVQPYEDSNPIKNTAIGSGNTISISKGESHVSMEGSIVSGNWMADEDVVFVFNDEIDLSFSSDEVDEIDFLLDETDEDIKLNAWMADVDEVGVVSSEINFLEEANEDLELGVLMAEEDAVSVFNNEINFLEEANGDLELPDLAFADLADEDLDPSPEKDTDNEASSIDKKHIKAWVSEKSKELLIVGESYTLNFQVGDFIENNLAKTSSIHKQDLPETGLNTEWVISSSTVEITEFLKNSDISITHKEIGSKTVWLARFPLLIPRYKESEVQQLGIVPITSEDVNLTVLVFAKEKPYRQFDVNLNVVNTKLKAEIA